MKNFSVYMNVAESEEDLIFEFERYFDCEHDARKFFEICRKGKFDTLIFTDYREEKKE